MTDFFGLSEKTHFYQLPLEPVRSGAGEVVISAQEETPRAGLDVAEGESVYMAAMEGRRVVHDHDAMAPPRAREGIQESIRSGRAPGSWPSRSTRSVPSKQSAGTAREPAPPVGDLQILVDDTWTIV